MNSTKPGLTKPGKTLTSKPQFFCSLTLSRTIERNLRGTDLTTVSRLRIVMFVKTDSMKLIPRIAVRFLVTYSTLNSVLDATIVFLDLPAPWDAVEHAKKALRVSQNGILYQSSSSSDPPARKTEQHVYVVSVPAWNKYYAP
jgi:hypothetical protein